MSRLVTGGADIQRSVEDFLYYEAELLDGWELDTWLKLFTEDAGYTVPCTDLPNGDPLRDLVFINDDMMRLRGRVERLNSRRAHREFPWSRTRRLITNVRVQDGVGGIVANSNFLVYRIKGDSVQPFMGRYIHRLVREGEELLIKHRRAELDLYSLRPHGTLSIIL